LYIFVGGVYPYTDLDGGWGYRITVDGTAEILFVFSIINMRSPILDCSATVPGEVFKHKFINICQWCRYLPF